MQLTDWFAMLLRNVLCSPLTLISKQNLSMMLLSQILDSFSEPARAKFSVCENQIYFRESLIKEM